MKHFISVLAVVLSLSSIAVSFAATTPGATDRGTAAVYQFRKANACPATGKIQTTCPGYVIDHVVPLCAGGADAVENMQWQTSAASYKKDALERDICRRLSACAKPAPAATPKK